MPLEAYIEFNIRLYKALIAPSALLKEAGTSKAERAEIARKTALADWEHDTQHAGGRMTQQTFSDSVFELVDVWSEGTDETEYAALMWRLSRAVMNGTDEADAFVTWKRGDEIESAVQSETKKLIRQYVADSYQTPTIASTNPTKQRTGPRQHNLIYATPPWYRGRDQVQEQERDRET